MSNSKKADVRLDLDATREKLTRLGLEHVAGLLEDKLSAAARDEIPPYRFLEQILDDELSSREERRIRTSLRLSGLPTRWRRLGPGEPREASPRAG